MTSHRAKSRGGETGKLDLWLTGVTVTHTQKIRKRKIIDELYICASLELHTEASLYYFNNI